jgi:hypothetical protein
MYGIQTALPAISMTGNTVRNMVGNSTFPATVVQSGYVINVSTAATNSSTISRNTVHSLSNASGAAQTSIYAMDLTLPASTNITGNVIERNLIHSLVNTSTDNTSQMWGIIQRGSGTAGVAVTAVVKNNMIRLGLDAAGNSITSGLSFIGIRDIQGATGGAGTTVVSYYFNSVYIGGTGVASSSSTFAFNGSALTSTRNYVDNIFWNARSNASGAGKNYAVSIAGTAPNPAGLTMNYNDLLATGTGGFTGLFNAVDQTTLANWQTATGQDANSLSADPLFVNANGSAATGNIHVQAGSPVLAAGIAVAGITNDFDNDTRDATPDIGADEIVAPVVNPGTLQFSSATYSVAENVGGGVATITVTRTGGSSGAASVQYATSNGTANGGASCGPADVDYVNASGTLNWADGDSAPKSFNVSICNESIFENDETVNLTLSTFTGASAGSPIAATLTITNDDAAPPTVTAGQLLISEFRLRGPGGAQDEFIEIYNNTNADIAVGATDGLGFTVAASDGVARCTILNGTIIKARGHFLCVNSVGYSLGSYPGGNSPTGGLDSTGPQGRPSSSDDNDSITTMGVPVSSEELVQVNGPVAVGDASYTTDIGDNVGIALFRAANPANFTLANRLDAVGSASEANIIYKEGTGYPALSGASYLAGIEYSFVRDNCGKSGSITTFGPCPTGPTPRDTDNNAVDFFFVDTNATSAGAGQRLGAPGPQNLTAPIERTAQFAALLLDATAGSSFPPNRVRDLTSDIPNNSMFGTLSLRKRVVNNTGAAITRLRFRIVDFTTFPAPGGIADLRARTSTLVVVSGINDAATCLASNGVATTPCTVNVQGTTLEQPPSQGIGGGFNSTLSAGTVTLGTPLANGGSLNLQFLLGIQQTGKYRFFIIVEALP